MRITGVLVAIAAVCALVGCASPASPGSSPAGSPASGFPVGAGVDYQLGGAYPPPEGVGIVARDSTGEPAEGVWSICYVNGFQTQPGDARWDAAPEVLLRDAAGDPVVDPNWPDETLLDTSTSATRERIAAIVGDDIARCADAGFDAVEFDNIDSFARADGLSIDGNLALAELYLAQAHELGLLAGQKNAAEHSARIHELGFDFVVAEECVAFAECGLYAEVYGDAVIDVEYAVDLAGLDAVCAAADRPRSTVVRDRDLVAADRPGYVFGACPDVRD